MLFVIGQRNKKMNDKVIKNSVLMIFFIIVSLIVEFPLLFLTSFICNFKILAIYLAIIISILTILSVYLISIFTF